MLYSKEFEQRVGRRPRLLIALLGEENFVAYGNEFINNGYKNIAKEFSNHGFDADIAPFTSTVRLLCLVLIVG